MLDKINNYITSNNYIYSEYLKLNVDYNSIIDYYKQIILLNRYIINDIDELKELQKVKPIISSNINSTTYHLVLIYKVNKPNILILFHDIKKNIYFYKIYAINELKVNFTKFNFKFKNQVNLYNILIY
jgi:hypothetical protein